MRYGNNIDLLRNQILNACFQVLPSAPSTPVQGQYYYDSTLGRVGCYDGTSWVYFGHGLGSVTSVGLSLPPIFTVSNSPVTTTGDLTAILASQIARTVLAAPAGANGTPDFRLLTAADISGLQSYILAFALNQFAVPIASVDMNGQRVVNLGTPAGSGDAVTKGYVDSLVNGTSWHQPVRTISLSNITLSGTQTVSGVALLAGDRVLVAGQTNGILNGFYIVAAGAWSRALDLVNGASAANAAIFVSEGTVGGNSVADSQWQCTNNSGSDIVGSDSLNFIQFGAGSSYLADGSTLQLSGNTFSIRNGGISDAQIAANAAIARSKVANGTAGQVVINDPSTGALSSEAQLSMGRGGTGAATPAGARANLGAVGKFAATFGNGSAVSYVINHNLGTQDVAVSFLYTANREALITDWYATDNNNITVSFAVAPSSNSIRVVVIG